MFESHFVGNPEERFSHVAASLIYYVKDHIQPYKHIYSISTHQVP